MTAIAAGLPSRWLIAAVLAFVVVWGCSQLLLDSVVPTQWIPELQTAVPRPGSEHRSRREGWATTHYGRFGVAGVADIRDLPRPRLAIWGSSHVAGYALADDAKVAARVRSRWELAHPSALGAYAIGIDGGDIAHLHHRVAGYQAVAPADHHFVVVTEMALLDPSEDPLREHAFFDGAFHHSPTRPGRLQDAIGLLHELRLDFVTIVGLRLRDLDLRLRPGQVAGDEPPSHAKDDPTERAEDWGQILEQMAARAGAPVTYLYVPHVPHLRRGRVERRDPDHERFLELRRVCTERNIRCRDLSPELVAAYRATGRFPRGFANHRPAAGHLNALGTDIVAAAIVEEWGRVTR